MTPQQMIEFLQKKLETEENLNPKRDIVFGQSYDRALPLDPDDFEIRHGCLYINTYEGM